MIFLQAKDEKSQHEAIERSVSVFKSLGPLAFFAILQPYTFMALYFAISNMVQKLPSMKEGGALWFTDLTTPDALYIFPAMASLSLLLRLEVCSIFNLNDMYVPSCAITFKVMLMHSLNICSVNFLCIFEHLSMPCGNIIM